MSREEFLEANARACEEQACAFRTAGDHQMANAMSEAAANLRTALALASSGSESRICYRQQRRRG